MDYFKYHFNYFDVIKRHERIINRPKDWEIKVLAIIMLFVTFCYVFTSGVFASTEVFAVDVSHMSIGENKAQENPNRTMYQYIVNAGDEYTCVCSGSSPQIVVKNTNGDLIQVGDDLQNIGTYSNLEEFTFTIPDNVGVIGIIVNNSNNVRLYNNSASNYDDSVSGLVNNVGTSQIWSVFENGISFIGVVVLVAFGLFLVVLAIKKVSKGKSEF